jgi:hypothetical protein
MARYIDADKLIDKIFPIGLIDDGKYTINAKAIKMAIDSCPTADVVPKSEVAAEVIDDLAREGLLNVEPWAIAELKKKYTEGEK